MKHPILENIEIRIAEVVNQYYANPSEELFQKWNELLREYSKKYEELKNV